MKKLKRKKDYKIKLKILVGTVLVLLFAQGYYMFFSTYSVRSPIIIQSPFVRKAKSITPVKPKIIKKVQPTATPTPKPVKVTIQSFKKYLTSDGAITREKVLAIVSKVYTPDEVVAFDNIMKKEAGYRLNAVNEAGACGIGQALPCSKMNCPLDDTGLECQTEWVVNYIKNRYGNPITAWEFHLAHNWY